jgi:hypothetical protein
MPIHKVKEKCCIPCRGKLLRIKLRKQWVITSNNVEYVITTKHKLYNLRYTIMSRCYNAKPKEFPHYQGKSIQVFKKWQDDPCSFYQWCLDHGWKKDLSIDRINSEGDYEPNNCQFISLSENSKKTHRERNMFGETAPNAVLKETQVLEIKRLLNLGVTCVRLARDFGVKKNTIGRIKRGETWKHLK